MLTERLSIPPYFWNLLIFAAALKTTKSGKCFISGRNIWLTVEIYG